MGTNLSQYVSELIFPKIENVENMRATLHSNLKNYFRLPIVQGGTFSFMAPTFAILALERNQCPADFGTPAWLQNRTQENRTEEWQIRMREIQGLSLIHI